ncbi:UPF0481 protein At3g47200-like [Lycium barbarum]|uniref:UPF0481 protein At3g47200-like n=1 Tax=Lycium barbarum TaxID=112863 RepID=UPI00293F4945|nr:UPF0481 protein At3g47200-like [Lycium barbarum]
MMLLDACLLLSFMLDINSACRALDAATRFAIFNDIMLLENQIPLWILKRLATSIYGDGNIIAEGKTYSSWEELLGEFCKQTVYWGSLRKAIEIGSSDEDYLHLLQLYWEVHVSGYNTGRHNAVATPSTCSQKYFRCAAVSTKERKVDVNSFRSVRDLKSKGIWFKPSSQQTLRGIKFKSYCLFAQLELPPLFIDAGMPVLYANVIAYEMSNTGSWAVALEITNYVNFLKSLVISAGDVKELREQEILFNCLGTDEEANKVLQEIPAGRIFSFGNILNVALKIQQHTSSKKRIFLAELFWTHFSSPWSFMTLLVAIVLLGLTLAQTYFTIYPRK